VVVFGKSADKDWEDGRPWSMLIQAATLPKRMGNTDVDNDHGEVCGLLLEEATLPVDVVVIEVTDLTVAGSKIIKVQDKDCASTCCQICSAISGVSKSAATQLEQQLQEQQLLQGHCQWQCSIDGAENEEPTKDKDQH